MLKLSLEAFLQRYVVLMHAGSMQELLGMVNTPEVDVLLCEDAVQGGTWRDTLETVKAYRPGLPVIVLSRTGGEKKWMEVIEAGAFDLLAPPFSLRHVLSVVEQAASCEIARRSQLQTR